MRLICDLLTFLTHIMKLNRTSFLKIGLVLSLTAFAGFNVQAQDKLHVLKLKKAKDLHAFFKYTGNDVPIISGHRGGWKWVFRRTLFPLLKIRCDILLPYLRLIRA